MSMEIITEETLAAFRAEKLSPASVLKRLPGPEGALLFDEPPGVGKSTLARNLIPAALSGGRDLVILVAPTRAILGELPEAEELGVGPAEMVVFEARPRSQCGPLDPEWSSMERQGCSALARDRLCASCPHRRKCAWPDQLDRIGKRTKLIVLVEQYLILNPTIIPSLVYQAEAAAPLVLLDEALFLTQAMTRRFTRPELARFAEALKKTSVDHDLGEAALVRWRADVAFLMSDDVDIDALPRFYAGGLEHAVLAVQDTGRRLFSERYRHLAADLALLNSSVTTGQWLRDETFEIAVRVDLGSAEVVVLAPYLDAALVEERLQRRPTIANPGVVFRHSGTSIVNIRDGVGSARSMAYEPHRRRVVDAIAALTFRNALAGRRTALVAKKDRLSAIKKRLLALASAAGLPRRIHAPGELPSDAGPWDVPLLNFGIVGVNTLKDFDAVYCVGAYNVNEAHLSSLYQRDLPPDRRVSLRLRSADRRRRVESADGAFSSRWHARRARSLHRTLERRVVLQAVGRARPFTSPTEVVLFQQDDFDDVLGDIETHDTLGGFRDEWSIPTAAEIARSALGDQMRPLRESGASYRDLANKFEVSVSIAHKALAAPTLAGLLGSVGR